MVQLKITQSKKGLMSKGLILANDSKTSAYKRQLLIPKPKDAFILSDKEGRGLMSSLRQHLLGVDSYFMATISFLGRLRLPVVSGYGIDIPCPQVLRGMGGAPGLMDLLSTYPDPSPS